MHWVYLLYSPSADRYYVGESENPHVRVGLHNAHFFPGAYTKIANDWRVEVTIPCKDRTHARSVEAYIKRQRKRTFTQRLINDPGLRTWVAEHCNTQ